MRIEMDDDRIIAELEDLGFTEYQSSAYLAAVRLGTARFSELVDESGVPQQRIYDVVDELRAEGMVEVHERSGVKEVVATAPAVALEDLKERRLDELSRTVEELVDGLEQSFERAEPEQGFVTVVTHESSAERHARRAIEEADWHLTLSLTPPAYRTLEPDILDALDRGTTVRLVIQDGDDGEGHDDLHFPGDMAVRYRPSADRLVAADREYAVFQGVASPVVTRPYLVTRDRNLVVVLKRYSEQFWSGSEVVQEADWTTRRYLSPWDAVVDLRDLIDDGVELQATIEGIETATGRERRWEGQLTDYVIESGGAVDVATTLPEVVSLTLERDGETLTVGGWDATLEDIAAEGIEVRKG